MARKHHDLKVWQQAMSLVTMIYKITSSFPNEEKFGLTSQMRRAAVSVPSNIAEGAGRTGAREFCRFLSVARGSLSELETQVMIAERLGYMEPDSHIENNMAELFAMLAGLLRANQKVI